MQGNESTGRRGSFGYFVHIFILFLFWFFVLLVMIGIVMIEVGVYQERDPGNRPGLGIVLMICSYFPFMAAWYISVFLTVAGIVRGIITKSWHWWAIVSCIYLLLGIGVFVLIPIYLK
jgi:hypothetical protein